ncbi:GNAT family N-acetyltransferase [Methylomicrobium lacus]
MIRHEWRGRGLARLLMQYVEDSAARSGHRIIRLTCFPCFEKAIAGTG